MIDKQFEMIYKKCKASFFCQAHKLNMELIDNWQEGFIDTVHLIDPNMFAEIDPEDLKRYVKSFE